MADPAAVTSARFKAAHATAEDWAETVKRCVEGLGDPPPGANLGFLYATDALAGDMASILSVLRGQTGVLHWVGSVGIGVAASGVEYHDQPALAVMVAALPEDAFRVFAPVTDGLGTFQADHGTWLTERDPLFGVVHGDHRNRAIGDILSEVAAETSTFLVGGLAASRSENPQVAETVTEGGLSGVMFAPEVAVATGLTQGCTPIGPRRSVTEAERGVVMTIDGRPALDVFKEDIGEALAQDLRRVGGIIFAAFPIAGSDTGDYVVRNLTAIDLDKGWIAIAEDVKAGRELMFCRRDRDSALSDLSRMVKDVKRRAGASAKAALYYSCVARGPHLFGTDSEELRLIRDELGDLPLAGFFGNGEISHNRLYAYTGVLAVFS